MIHDHTLVHEEPAPTVDRIEVTRVRFRRGAGCCEESPVRMVTAYYDIDGLMIAEVDVPAAPLSKKALVWDERLADWVDDSAPPSKPPGVA